MMSDQDDDFEIGSEPRCEVCGTVMRMVDGGYQCGGCGYEVDIPWIEHPGPGDVPGIHGG